MGGKGDGRTWDGWVASPTWWTWVWASSMSWWWTGKPSVLQSMGSQRVGHDWVTELSCLPSFQSLWFHLSLHGWMEWRISSQNHRPGGSEGPGWHNKEQCLGRTLGPWEEAGEQSSCVPWKNWWSPAGLLGRQRVGLSLTCADPSWTCKHQHQCY